MYCSGSALSVVVMVLIGCIMHASYRYTTYTSHRTRGREHPIMHHNLWRFLRESSDNFPRRWIQVFLAKNGPFSRIFLECYNTSPKGPLVWSSFLKANKILRGLARQHLPWPSIFMDGAFSKSRMVSGNDKIRKYGMKNDVPYTTWFVEGGHSWAWDLKQIRAMWLLIFLIAIMTIHGRFAPP